jgi:hypothetical protein
MILSCGAFTQNTSVFNRTYSDSSVYVFRGIEPVGDGMMIIAEESIQGEPSNLTSVITVNNQGDILNVERKKIVGDSSVGIGMRALVNGGNGIFWTAGFFADAPQSVLKGVLYGVSENGDSLKTTVSEEGLVYRNLVVTDSSIVVVGYDISAGRKGVISLFDPSGDYVITIRPQLFNVDYRIEDVRLYQDGFLLEGFKFDDTDWDPFLCLVDAEFSQFEVIELEQSKWKDTDIDVEIVDQGFFLFSSKELNSSDEVNKEYYIEFRNNSGVAEWSKVIDSIADYSFINNVVELSNSDLILLRTVIDQDGARAVLTLLDSSGEVKLNRLLRSNYDIQNVYCQDYALEVDTFLGSEVLIGGFATCLDLETYINTQNLWLVKLDSALCFDTVYSCPTEWPLGDQFISRSKEELLSLYYSKDESGIHIVSKYEREHLRVTVSSLAGTVIHSEDGECPLFLNTEYLPTGIYIVSVATDSDFFTAKKIFIY